MSERKCFSKYNLINNQYQKIPSSISKASKKKIRFMLPITVNCKTCFSKISKGKKLNAIKEKVLNKNYFGINFFRFYFRCFNCLTGSSITTNLKDMSYNPEINCF